MKIAVIGTGAMGSIYASFLAKSNNEVLAIDLWEAHLKYIDIHYILKGEEKIEVGQIKDATLTKTYDEAGDYALYEASGESISMHQGDFMILFPNEVHKTAISINNTLEVKKIVFKTHVNHKHVN